MESHYRLRGKPRPRLVIHTDRTYPDDPRKRRRRFIVWLRRGGQLHLLLGLAVLVYLAFLLRLLTSPRAPDAVGSGTAHSRAHGAMGRSATPMARAARLANARQADEDTVHRTANSSAYFSIPIPREPVKRIPLPADVMSAKHSVRNGMLEVDASSTIHPVYQLMRDARRDWDAKLARQSKTLKQAVDEYVRRYRRAPPPGFDKWWNYVVDNNVQLPDEYDQIDKDLVPFRALHPNDILKRVAKAASEPDTFTIKVRRGLVRTSASVNGYDELHMSRRTGQYELIRPIAKYLPDMTVVYTVHDTPSNFVSHEHKEELLEHIEEDEYIDGDDKIDLTLRGWAEGCPRRTPLRSFNESADLLPPSDAPGDKTFIADHKASMDPCTNPELVRLHGFLAGKQPIAEELSAKFAISKTLIHSDVLGIPPERVETEVPLIPWAEKTQSRLLWRGTNTGMFYAAHLPWRDSHRVRLMRMGEEEGGAVVLSPPEVMRKRSIINAASLQNKGTANARLFDMAFVDGPIQCEHEDGTCHALATEYPYRPRVDHDQADMHKYVVDVDGNAWSARFQRLLMSGSLVFKSTIMPEWYNDRIQPWVHYVPIKLDYSDLRDALAFFAGDVHGDGGRDDLAENIGMTGREWAENFYRKEDMVAYVFRLYLEWARLQAPNRRAKVFRYDPTMERERS